jgi:hypothetical protein
MLSWSLVLFALALTLAFVWRAVSGTDWEGAGFLLFVPFAAGVTMLVIALVRGWRSKVKNLH